MKNNLTVIVVMMMAMLMHKYASAQAPDAAIVQRIFMNAPTLQPGFQYTLDQKKVQQSKDRLDMLIILSKDPEFKNICARVSGCGIDLIGDLTPKLLMVPVPEILLSDVDPSRFSSIEQLMNTSKAMPVQVVRESSPGFNLTVSQNDTIQFVDYSKEDDDKISVYFNGKIAHSMISIEHMPFVVPFGSDIQEIEIVAEDEGAISPCTLEVLVNNTATQYSLQKGQSIKILRR